MPIRPNVAVLSTYHISLQPGAMIEFPINLAYPIMRRSVHMFALEWDLFQECIPTSLPSRLPLILPHSLGPPDAPLVVSW